jgi:F0F1-type ATP synthase assembly protein I
VLIDRRTSQLLGLAWGFGWRVAAGVMIGFYLDAWLGTSPLFLVVFAVGSLVAATVDLIRASRPHGEEGQP